MLNKFNFFDQHDVWQIEYLLCDAEVQSYLLGLRYP